MAVCGCHHVRFHLSPVPPASLFILSAAFLASNTTAFAELSSTHRLSAPEADDADELEEAVVETVALVAAGQ